MNKKSVYLSVSGILIFLISIIAINITVTLSVRIIWAIGCLIGTILFFFSNRWYKNPILWLRLAFDAMCFLTVLPTINIFGWLAFNQTLPKHIYYPNISGTKDIIATVVIICLFLSMEIGRKIEKKPQK
ncbi:MAG: hypothetical protein PHX21_04015 [bacterium]|nr:hypothetical protein [bacterium]